MAAFSFILLAINAAVAHCSPRNLIARGQGHNSSPGTDSTPQDYSHGGSWGSGNDGWDSSEYGGSWGHSTTSNGPGSQYGPGGWGHSSTCAVSTIVEYSTLTVSGSGSTVYISGSGFTETLGASTVYISGSDYTSYLPASTVYISGSDHTSYLPASTLTIAGPAETYVSTAHDTTTRPAVPTTIFVTQNGQGWNRTVTYEEVVTTTQHEVSTIYNEETTTATSAVTLPGESLAQYLTKRKLDLPCV